MVNPVLNCYFRDNQQHISQHNINSYNHFIKNNFIDLIKRMNDNSKIVKYYNNYSLEAQVFIGGENVDQLYLYPPRIRQEKQKDQQIKGGGKQKKHTESKIDKIQELKDEILDEYGDKVYKTIIIQEQLFEDNVDKSQVRNDDVKEQEEIISNSSSDEGVQKRTQNVLSQDYSELDQPSGRSLSENIKDQVFDNIMNKLDLDSLPEKKQAKTEKIVETGNDHSKDNVDVVSDLVPINFNDIIKGGKTIYAQEDVEKKNKTKKENKYLYPNEARLKNLSYSSELRANIIVQYKYYQIKKQSKVQTLVDEQPFKDMYLCDLPIMLKSCLCILNGRNDDFLKYVGECPYDQGGYFIIQGQEKVIIAQERQALNKLFVQDSRKSDLKYQCKGQIRSTSQKDEFFPKTIYIRQYKEDKKRRHAICIHMPFDGGVIEAKEVEIPIYIMFRALNIENDVDINNIINPQDEEAVRNVLYYCKQDSQSVYDQEQAFDYIQKQIAGLTMEGVQTGLVENLFPNLGESFYNKAMVLGKVIYKFIKTSVGEIQPTDKDSMFIKRIDTGGQLYENMIRDIFNKFRDIGKSAFDNILMNNKSLQYEKLIQSLNANNFNKTYPQNYIQEHIDAQMKGKYGLLTQINSRTKKKVVVSQPRDGVVQDLSRTSYLLYIDMQRKVINHQNSDDIKIVGPHLLHCSQFGYFCPSDTPDGNHIGIHKHLSALAIVSQNISSKGAIDLCKDLGVIEIQNCTRKQSNEKINIYVNSMFYGIYEGQMNINQLLYYLILIKRNGLINITTSITCNFQQNEINILSDSGRAIRPLIILKNNQHVFNQSLIKKINNRETTWQDLTHGQIYKKIRNFDPKKKIQESYYYSPKEIFETDEIHKLVKSMEQCQCAIEYLDYEMSENALIAIDEKKLQENELKLQKFMDKKVGNVKGILEDDYYFYTHLEIDPSALLSPVQNHSPFLNHNPSNRNLLSCQQSKHSVGLPYTNFNNRLDTQCYILNNPQRSLCASVYQKYYNTNSLGFGFNAFIAVMTYTGQNQEDAVLFNKGSVERGMFDTTYFKSFSEVEERNDQQKIAISFQKDNTIEEYYDKTDENGLPKIGSVLTQEDDILLSKIRKSVDTNLGDVTVEQKQTVDERFINKKVKNKYLGFTVDKVFVFLNNNNRNEVKVRLRQNRKMQLGDKVGSRQAQKGVVGGFINPEDMPYTQDGEVPDLIITPNAFPTRQTVAYFLEACISKIALRNGTFMDSTAFRQDKNIIKNINQILTEMELNSKCQRIFYNGFNGDQIKGDIFYAPMFYMKLKQMAVDKINARGGDGKIDKNTRTPVQGRSQGGGPKLGNMEIDSLQAHGVQSFIKESLLNKSNLFILQLCNDCGRLAQYKGMCSHCNGTNIKGLDTSFSYKQFLQELNQMHIKCTFDVEGNEGYYN